MPTITGDPSQRPRTQESGQGRGGLPMLERGAARGALAAIILLFVPGLLDPFESPKAIIVRVVGVSALAGVLFHFIARFKLSAFTVGDRQSRQRAGLAADVGVVAWAAASLVATACSVSPRLSLFGELQQRDGLLTTLGLVGLYAMTRHSHRRAKDVRRTVHVFLASAAIAAGYALVQFTGHDPWTWAGAMHYPSGAGLVLRPFGTLGNPILLGAMLAPALGIVTVRMVTGSSRIGWWCALFSLLSIALLTTLSRGAWLSAACTVLAAVSGAAWYRVGRSHRQASLALLAAAVAPAWVAMWSLRSALLARAGESLAPETGSALVRREIARAALSLWRSRPWLGTGPDTFGLMFPSVQPLAYGGGLCNGLPIHAHSVALQILATTGVLGALAGVLWVAALFAQVPRRSPNGEEAREQLALQVACVSLRGLGAFNHVGIAGAALFVVLAAMLCRGRDDVSAIAGADAHASVTAALACAVAIAIAWRAVPEIEALAAAGRARAAIQQSVSAGGERRWTLVESAAREAAAAAAHAPGEDQLWRLSCDGELALGREALRRQDVASAGAAFERGESSARRACTLEPLRAANFHALGTAIASRAHLALETQRPDSEVAGMSMRSDSAFAEARRLGPLDALVLIDQTRAQLELGQATAAQATAQRIVQLYPEAATGYSLLAAAQLMLGERPAAALSLRAAVQRRWMPDQGADERAANAYLRQLESADSSR